MMRSHMAVNVWAWLSLRNSQLPRPDVLHPATAATPPMALTATNCRRENRAPLSPDCMRRLPSKENRPGIPRGGHFLLVLTGTINQIFVGVGSALLNN